MSYGIPKPVNCVGKKGRSGRKSLSEEMAKRQAYIKAWNKVNNEIDKRPVTEVALPIALRTMTEKKEITGTINIDGLLDKVK